MNFSKDLSPGPDLGMDHVGAQAHGSKFHMHNKIKINHVKYVFWDMGNYIYLLRTQSENRVEYVLIVQSIRVSGTYIMSATLQMLGGASRMLELGYVYEEWL